MSTERDIVIALELAVRFVRAQIHDAVLVAMREFEQGRPAQTLLLDRSDLARALGISVATVDRLAHEGMPSVRLVDSRRYILADTVAWLKTRSADAS